MGKVNQLELRVTKAVQRIYEIAESGIEPTKSLISVKKHVHESNILLKRHLRFTRVQSIYDNSDLTTDVLNSIMDSLDVVDTYLNKLIEMCHTSSIDCELKELRKELSYRDTDDLSLEELVEIIEDRLTSIKQYAS